MPDPEVVDAQVVDEHQQDMPPPDDQTAASTPGAALAVIEPRAGAIIAAEDPREILAKAHQIAAPLKELIESAKLAVNLDRRNPDRKHVEVGGWQACGTMLGALGGQPLHAETVWTRRLLDDDGRLQRTRYTATVKRYHPKNQGGGLKSETTYDVDGYDWEARVEIRTPSTIVVGAAEAMVSRAEETWSQRDDYALRSMAETRAESRAWRKAMGWIVHLAGYNPTPAEEMGHTPGADTSPAGPPFGPKLDADQREAVMTAIRQLVELDQEPAAGAGVIAVDDVAKGVAQAIVAMTVVDEGGQGYMPAIVGRALCEVANARTSRATAALEAQAQDQSGEAPDDPSPEDIEEARRQANQPAPGTVTVTLSKPDDPETCAREWKAAGCTCPDPTTEMHRRDDCPIAGHAIPF